MAFSSSNYCTRLGMVGVVEAVLLCGLGLKTRGFLKTRNIALPPQMRIPGCLGMSVNSVFQVACKVYLKKSLQDFVQEYKD
jgi:hypothetical protein